MHETQCYEVGEVADEVKDEEKKIDVTGVEVEQQRTARCSVVETQPAGPVPSPLMDHAYSGAGAYGGIGGDGGRGGDGRGGRAVGRARAREAKG